MLVNNYGVILSDKWKHNDFSYEIISVENSNNIWKCIDTVKRSDGEIKSFSRLNLQKYFQNAEIIK